MRHIDKFSEIKRILILVLFFNWLVAFSKIIYGIITRCASMVADGVHSFGDGASNIIGLIGIWVASKPEDEEHPYGHKKFETFATLGIAFILFLAAFNILKEAFLRIFHPVVPEVTIVSFTVMVVTIAINIFIIKFEQGKGRHLSSDILICDAQHTKSDVFSSLVVVGTLISIKLGLLFLDTVVAAIIAILIAKTGFEILRASSSVLCDASALSRARISTIVKNIHGVKAVHNIRTRGRKDDIHIDLHIITDSKMSVEQAHSLSHYIELNLKSKIPGVTDVIVHIEPSGTN